MLFECVASRPVRITTGNTDWNRFLQKEAIKLTPVAATVGSVYSVSPELCAFTGSRGAKYLEQRQAP